MTRKAQILVVDDHAMVRYALRHFIDSDAAFHVCADAEDEPQALRAIQRHKPDLVLVDLFLRIGDGLSLTKAIRARYAHLPVIMLTMHRGEIFGPKARRAGASSYVTKSEALDKLMPAMRRALKKA